MKSVRFVLLSAACLFVLFGISVSPAAAQADATVRGQVRAAADESVIANAAVTLRPAQGGDSLQASADDDGRFAFVGVRPGEYILAASAGGFRAREVRLVIAPREVPSVTLALDVASVEVRVEVAADSPLPTTHSPSSTLLTAERIEMMPLARRTSLPDAIVTAAPGMIRGHDDFVHIRGHEVALNPSINGVQFWENAHAVFSPGLGVDYIQSVNVMTGGFAAEYGNRFGGILDVVTKSGWTMRNLGSVTVGTGSAQRHNAGVEIGGSRSRIAYYLNGAGFSSDRFLSPPSPRSIHNTGRGLRTFGRLDVRASDRQQLALIVTGDSVGFELPMDERDALLRPAFRNEQRARSQSAILSWNHARSSTTMVEASAYQRWSDVRQHPDTIDPFGAQTNAERTLNTLGVKSNLTRIAGRHAVKTGIDVVMLRPHEQFSYLSQPWIDFTHLPTVNESHVHFRGPNLGAGIPRPVLFEGAETGGQASLFAQDTLQLGSRLTIDAGARLDHYSLEITETHLSPRLNTAFRLRTGTVLFGSYNHFFVPPPIENILAGSAGLTQQVSEIGRALPPVQAIKEDQFEAGVSQSLPGAGSIGVTGYYRLSQDPAHTSLFPDSRFYTYATFDKGKAYGMEIKASLPRIGTPALSGYVNYALGRVWFDNPIVAGFTIEADHLTESGRILAPMDQTHTATAALSYRHESTGLWSTVSAEYGSGTPGSHGAAAHEDGGEAHEHASGPGLCGVRCPARVTPSLTLGWNPASSSGAPSRLSLQFAIENLTNRVYLLSKESSMVQGQYSAPRLISASVRMRF